MGLQSTERAVATSTTMKVVFMILVVSGFAAAIDLDINSLYLDAPTNNAEMMIPPIEDITPQNPDDVQLFVDYITLLLKKDQHSAHCIQMFRGLFSQKGTVDRALEPVDALSLVETVAQLLTRTGHSPGCVRSIRHYLNKQLA